MSHNPVNIDLFLNPHGEAGLLFDRLPLHAPAGAIYDAQTRDLTLEIAGGATDPLHLNIGVEDSHNDLILLTQKIYVGALKDGRIGLSLEIPLYYLNDPYGSAFADNSDGFAPRRSMTRFEQFMKRCSAAQPVHRADLGDEDMVGSVLRGMNPRALEFVPELLRHQLLEKNRHAKAEANIIQSIVPGGMGQSSMQVVRHAADRRDEESGE